VKLGKQFLGGNARAGTGPSDHSLTGRVGSGHKCKFIVSRSTRVSDMMTNLKRRRPDRKDCQGWEKGVDVIEAQWKLPGTGVRTVKRKDNALVDSEKRKVSNYGVLLCFYLM